VAGHKNNEKKINKKTSQIVREVSRMDDNISTENVNRKSTSINNVDKQLNYKDTDMMTHL